MGNLVVLIPYEEFIKKIIEVLREVYGSGKTIGKVCYVTLNKPYKALVKVFEQEGVDIGDLFVIDGVTKTVVPSPEKVSNCIYTSSPISTEENLPALTKALTRNTFDVMILDSLSTLLIYMNQEEAILYIKGMIALASTFKTECIITCLKEDAKPDLVESLGDFVDKVIDLTK